MTLRLRAKFPSDALTGDHMGVQSRLTAVRLAIAVWAVAITWRSDVAAAQAPLRTMTFNIRYGTASDGAHSWPHRRAHVIDVIRDHAPHVLGFQEALRGQLDELAPALPPHREIGVGRDDGRTAGEYSALYVDSVRFEVISAGTFWFSDTPAVAGSMTWGNRIPRICTWARLVDRATRDTLRVYNLHWDHESQPSRQKAAGQLLERLARDGSATDRVVVLGDFNADEGNPAYRAVVTDGRLALRDAFRAVHRDARVVGTFNGFRGDSTGGMIDHVLAGTGWRVLAAGIDRRKYGALWPSDHFPVWAVLQREAR
jgi:endonuclease/exonuclease/phosphatase family metal-dependent hydrolase